MINYHKEKIIKLYLCHHLRKFLKLHIAQTKTVSIPASYCYYIFLGTFFLSWFNSPSSRSSSRFKEFSFEWLKAGFYLIREKGNLAEMTTRSHSLSFVVIRCHLLYRSLLFVVTRYHSLYHLLSLVVIRCQSLLIDVSLVCLFINDPYRQSIHILSRLLTLKKVNKYRSMSHTRKAFSRIPNTNISKISLN